MHISKKHLIFAACIAFLAFVGFSFLVHKNLFISFDFDNTVRLQDHVSRKFDDAFSLLSMIGSVEFASVILLLILLIYRKLKAFLALLLFGIFHAFEIYGKTFVHHFPPPHFMLRTHNLINYPQFYIREQNSYPSGHAARALFLTTILFLMVNKSKKLNPTAKVFIYFFLALYDIAMLTSRVYLGEHWTSDIIGGSLLGLSFALLGGLFL